MMVLSDNIITDIKEKSGLVLEQVKDYDILAHLVFLATGRNIGVTTLKRLFGQINDERKTNEYTLNTIGLFLGFKSWKEYISTKQIDSEWNFKDDTILIDKLDIGNTIIIQYLNRKVQFSVKEYDKKKILVVEKAVNSSLKEDDILFVHCLRKGEILEAEKIIRGNNVGNYKTHGEITCIETICEKR
jgi:hypothetical protein